jgi:hypothetical protein
MSTIEVAYDLRYVTDYLIGSTCEIMAYGMPYSIIGKNLTVLQQVTIGVKDYKSCEAPIIGDNVFISAGAKVIGNIIVNKEGETRPLVLNEEKIIVTGNEEAEQPSDGFTPMQTALLLLILTAAATIYGIRRKKTLWGIDFALFFAAGTAGCILAFLALFSQHPAVSPNHQQSVFRQKEERYTLHVP